MFASFRARELAALAPLLDLARQKTGAERREWIEDLRSDAPTLMARIEALLAAETATSPAADIVVSGRATPTERCGERANARGPWLTFHVRTR